jgi:hypothetical protein
VRRAYTLRVDVRTVRLVLCVIEGDWEKRAIDMRHSSTFKIACLAVSLLVLLPLCGVAADDTKDQPQSQVSQPAAAKPAAQRETAASKAQVKSEKEVPEMNLLDAMREGLVSAKAEGMGDGRMSLSLTNRSKRQLRVVLPPGIIAQSATGQFGGMGGMGGGMMGGGMGGMMSVPVTDPQDLAPPVGALDQKKSK